MLSSAEAASEYVAMIAAARRADDRRLLRGGSYIGEKIDKAPTRSTGAPSDGAFAEGLARSTATVNRIAANSSADGY